MTPLDSLRYSIAETTAAVAATLSSDRTAALLALVLADDAVQGARPGWNLALRLCLEKRDDHAVADDPTLLPHRAERFLAACDQLACASVRLAECAAGHLQLQQRGSHAFVAWATSRRLSPEQRERADFEWWSARLRRHVAPRLETLLSERPRMRQDAAPTSGPTGFTARDPDVERAYRQIGDAYLARFANQHSYPPDAIIGGATFTQYSEILATLIGWQYRARDRHALGDDEAHLALHERALIVELTNALGVDAAVIERALQCLTLDQENAAYHSTLAGRAAPPLLRLDAERLVWSARGLLGEPLIFLARELRRRHAQEYHNSAHLREGVFRQDLYRLFSDKRFVLSAGRIELKRSGEARTDLDALVFDRKTGTLGVFELKAQDPFARSVEERQRQRNNFLHANRQVSAILEWIQRRGADDLLVRFDERTAKRFHVQKAHVFVLGRYLAHFTGGPEPDRRAAWGSWPQVLQIVEDQPVAADARNPLGALFTRLHDATSPAAPVNADEQDIAVGDLRLRVFPSFAAMRSAVDGAA